MTRQRILVCGALALMLLISKAEFARGQQHAATSSITWCTLSGARDKDSCVRQQSKEDGANPHHHKDEKDDEYRPCVWCALGRDRSGGVCVSEGQAVTMAAIVPDLVRCHHRRYNNVGTIYDDVIPNADGDDPAPSRDDDIAPVVETDDDDAAPNTDDAAPPGSDGDDAAVVPDDDDYWKCLMQKDAKACQANDCTWCDTPVGFGVCMSGLSTAAAKTSPWFNCRHNADEDNDNNAAAAQEQVILDQHTDHHPLDPSSSCALVYWRDPSRDACAAAVDAHGHSCAFCTMTTDDQAVVVLELCLNVNQAATGEQFGFECSSSQDDEDDDATVGLAAEALYDPAADMSCSRAFWTDPSKDTCLEAMDAVHGESCRYCSVPGSIVLCVNAEQAWLLQTAGMECESKIVAQQQQTNRIIDPASRQCIGRFVLPGLFRPSFARHGNACSFCSVAKRNGSDAAAATFFGLCLTQDQANLASGYGLECNDPNDFATSATTTSTAYDDFPDDLFDCLEHYQEGDCRQSACIWCNTQVGMGLCVTEAVADTTKSCPFFDCEFGSTTNTIVRMAEIALQER